LAATWGPCPFEPQALIKISAATNATPLLIGVVKAAFDITTCS
jgi:hypothetical protein